MVFVKRKEKQAEGDLTIAATQGQRAKKGHVGIEVEVESSRANSIPKEDFGYWAFTPDGSLRGADNGEFILAKPLDFNKADEALDQLYAKLREAGATLVESNRTSVHVHLNVGDWYLNRLTSFFCLWYIFEEALSHWCGDHRVGNLFCIRAKDGPAIITDLKRFIEARGNYKLNNERLHYAALNAAAIHKFCSVEARTLKGCIEPETPKQWVRILKKLYEASERYTDPRTIVETFSLDGPMEFFRSVFEEEAEDILRGAKVFNDDDFRMTLFNGMRIAQDLAYARDWSDFNPVKSVVDPFGRKTPKTAPVVNNDFVAEGGYFEAPPLRERTIGNVWRADLATGAIRFEN